MPQKGIAWIQNHFRNKTQRSLNKLVGHWKRVVVLENNWLLPRDSNPDMLTQSCILETKGADDKRY
jgi:hypothetical protein